ncbi:MAG: helix-turn-helix domain-containing protein, partial [Pseudomonadota bacterium]|nr:helix-turn-helix domain-containing protein [Pseudomonadota bacterium]
MSSARRQTGSKNRRPRPPETDTTPIPQAPSPPAPERTSQGRVERIGEILRRTRERRGDDLHYIAEYLCIRRAFLEALEDSRYEEFPADAYVIGFLRSYSE